MAHLPSADYLTALREQLRRGEHVQAANTLGLLHAPSDMAEALQVVAKHFVEIGNNYESRGRPPVTWESDPKRAFRRMAANHHKRIVEEEAQIAWTAARIAAGKKVAVELLADLCWEVGLRAEGCDASLRVEQRLALLRAVVDDQAGAIETVKPLGLAYLRDVGLANLPLKGFKSSAKFKLNERKRKAK